ncbi:MAG: type II toxin-antitoxin system HicB family antitoxin [Aeromicrobium sp.]|nr:type II toxin-antitoxin system HicB family antitoxin [Burkholderiales bacterium]
MRYALVTEKAQGNFSGYVPDLPGCVVTGTAMEEIESQIREAIEFPLTSMILGR